MSYEGYQAPSAEPSVEPATPEHAGDGPWQVAVEYSNEGQAKPPTVVLVRGTRYVGEG